MTHNLFVLIVIIIYIFFGFKLFLKMIRSINKFNTIFIYLKCIYRKEIGKIWFYIYIKKKIVILGPIVVHQFFVFIRLLFEF